MMEYNKAIVYTMLMMALSLPISYAWSNHSIHYITNQTTYSPNKYGKLQPMPDSKFNNKAPEIHLLQLSGNATQRGYAHGYLLHEQIIDWSVFYLYKSNMKGNLTYYNYMYNSWNDAQFIDSEFKFEVDSMYQGMIDAAKMSGVDLFVPDYGRMFTVKDIYLMNAYLEVTPNNSFKTPGPFVGGKEKKSPACSQFVFWGDDSTSETLSGRNMDGECDDTYVTVSHLIVFAISGLNEKRFISIMWPGHVGGLSLFNEDGLYIMLNCGSTGDSKGKVGTTTTNVTGIEYFMRTVISTMDGHDANPSNIMAHVGKYKSSTGGISGSGSILVFARPSISNAASSSYGPPGFVVEVDRYGGEIRTNTDDKFVVATNHFVKYGVDEKTDPSHDKYSPWENFGLPVVSPGSTSWWRHAAVLNAVRSKIRVNKMTSDFINAKHILQNAGHGTTEHSVVFSPNKKRFGIAVAMPFKEWDAPYLDWFEYDFEEMF